ncbi:MAG: hypothetical protein AAGM22_25295 [Acidobacteriota bacterium]
MSEKASITRVLVAGAEGRNLILTEMINASSGTSVSWIQDDVSGWWARLEMRLPANSASLGEFFRSAHQAEEVDVKLSWKGTETASFEQPAVHTLDLMAQQFVEKLEERGELKLVSEAVPQELVPAVFFLEAHLSAESSLESEDPEASIAYSVRGVVEVLAKSMVAGARGKPHTDGSATEWVVTVGDRFKGRHLADSKLLELVGRFRSVENVDPLSDLEPELIGQ